MSPEAPAASPPSPDSPEKPRDAVREAGRSKEKAEKLSEGAKADALEWFLSDADEAFTHTVELNVGTPNNPKWIEWVVKPVDLETLRKIRQQSQPKARRGQAQTGEMDEVQANLRIVIEGTVEPDIRAATKEKGVVDPADSLRLKFRHKPGLLGQIAGEVMSISGYDDEDLREVEAAGN